MLKYNTHLKKLILPEYGRNIQNMVDHCLTIESRDERTQCAHTIVKTMATLFPSTGDPEEYRMKLWDHLAIMSDFALDIDWPFETVHAETLGTPPSPVVRDTTPIHRRHYGKLLEVMAWRMSKMPESPAREALALLIANHMKKQLTVLNPDGVEDERVLRDLYDMTQSTVRLDPAEYRLHDFKVLAPPAKKKKKK